MTNKRRLLTQLVSCFTIRATATENHAAAPQPQTLDEWNQQSFPNIRDQIHTGMTDFGRIVEMSLPGPQILPILERISGVFVRTFPTFSKQKLLNSFKRHCIFIFSSLALRSRHTLQSSHPSFLQCCYSNHLQAAPLQVLNICLFKLQMCRLLSITWPLLPSPACCQKTDGNAAFGLLHHMLATSASSSS